MPATLGETWAKLARIVQNYITCDDIKDVVRPRHLKLLVVLKQKCDVNLPTYLNFLLHDATRSIRKSRHVESVISHHGLIRLIVSYSLAQQQSSWEELVFSIDGGLALPAPKQKSIAGTSIRLQKQRQSIRLGRSRGMLGNPQENNSQPLEVYDSEDEKPPQLEGGENEEEELEENKKRNWKRELTTPARKKGRKQSNPAKAHYKTLCKKMNWPKFWPIWVSMSRPQPTQSRYRGKIITGKLCS